MTHPSAFGPCTRRPLLVIRRPEPDRALRSNRRADELPKGLEELIQLVIVPPELRRRLALELLQTLLQRRVGVGDAPQLDRTSA